MGHLHRAIKAASGEFRNKDSVLFRENLVAALLAAFFITSCRALVQVPGDFSLLVFPTLIDIPMWWGTLVSLPLILLGTAALLKAPRLVAWVLYGSALALAVTLALSAPNDLCFLSGLSVILFLVSVWVSEREDRSFGKVWQARHNRYVAVFLFLLFAVVVSYVSILRYFAFGAGGSDLGIFAQMFEYMKNTGLPLSSWERNELVSHLGIHLSPFFYLLLPGYMLFPTPVYLLAVQATAVGSGVFAVHGICRKLGFSPASTLPCLLIYSLYPTLSYGCLNDFHEHKFLAPCLLWVVYFVLSGNNLGLALSAALTLSLKEDAPIFLVTIALYMVLARGEFQRGVWLAGASLAWFAIALTLLELFGQGLMTHRYGDFVLPGQGAAQGLCSIIEVSFFDIGYTIRLAFEKGRIEFIAWTFIPVLFAPFFHPRVAAWCLLLPMLLVNLLSSWPAQYDIFSQHVFGTVALLLASTFLACQQVPGRIRRVLLLASPAICLTFSAALFGVHLLGDTETYYEHRAEYAGVDRMLQEVIPLDATVTSANYIAPHLYRQLHLFSPAFTRPTEYLVLDARNNDSRLRARLAYYERIASQGLCDVYRIKPGPRGSGPQEGR